MGKGESKPFRQGPPPQKSSSGGRRISFSRRPGPDSRVAPNSSFPREGPLGKKFSEKGTFLQHASRIDPTREHTFCSRGVIFIRGRQLAGRSKHFLKNWKKLTGYKKKFENCAGLQNPISHGSNPGQGSSQSKNEYRSVHFSESRNRKHVAERCHSESATYFRRVFKQPISGRQIRWRKEVSDKPEKPKFVYTSISKWNCLHLLKDLLQEGDYMCKIDLRDAYFTITINKKYRKDLRFKWEGTLYEFLCLCFGLTPAPLIFTKLMKVPISLLWRLNIRLIIYLNNG